jgi:hypothetical protein
MTGANCQERQRNISGQPHYKPLKKKRKKPTGRGNNGQRKAIHIVSAWTDQTGLVLGQAQAEEKSKEITAIPDLLEALDISGCIARRTKLRGLPEGDSSDYCGQRRRIHPGVEKESHTGMWEDDNNFQSLGVHNETGARYTVTGVRGVGGSSSFSTNYAILTVYPDWIPGERITVSCYATGKEYSFSVPKEDS